MQSRFLFQTATVKKAVLSSLISLVLLPGMAWAQALLESPQQASFESGIGVIQGWVCDSAEIEISIDNGARFPAASGLPRGDTASVCGDSNNGFALLFNWNLVGDGGHSLQAYADGVPFADVTFTVTTLGAEFLTGAAGEYVLDDFPSVGESLTVRWVQAKGALKVNFPFSAQCPINA